MENVIYKDDPEYPELLKKIGKEAPKQLYFKSSYSEISSRFSPEGALRAQKFQNTHSKIPDAPNIFEDCLAVVGSRRLTSYGKRAIEKIVGEIAISGVTIVSGFMYGGDAAAHGAAVRVGGRTIAVMPCGIERIHPEDQKQLYDEILGNNGLIISEYEGDMQPALWTYPRRNRIVAGLAKAVLVIEAGEESGSLITANYARKFKRKIFALPGPITSSVSAGTNQLIKRGAEMVLSAEDILRYYKSSHFVMPDSPTVIPDLIGNPALDSCFRMNDRSDMNDRKKAGITGKNSKGTRSVHDSENLFSAQGALENEILRELEREPMSIDELSRKLETPASELGVKLSMMEIGKAIEREDGKWRIRE